MRPSWISEHHRYESITDVSENITLHVRASQYSRMHQLACGSVVGAVAGWRERQKGGEGRTDGGGQGGKESVREGVTSADRPCPSLSRLTSLSLVRNRAPRVYNSE